MLQYYIQRHGSMRNQLVQHRRMLQPHQLINLNRELSVLTRTSIVASQRTAPRTPFLTMNPTSKDTDTIRRVEAHYARMKFVNVTLARFTNKCQVEHDKMITKRGKELGIWTFYKWKKMCHIKQRLRELLDNSALTCMRLKYKKWQAICFNNGRRYIYSTVRTKHIHLEQQRTRRACFVIWRTYTKRLQRLRLAIWKVSLRSYKIYKYILEWRMVGVRIKKMRKFIRKSLASSRDKHFLLWQDITQYQIAVRRRFVTKWQLRKAAGSFRKWKARYRNGCIVAMNIHRLYHGNRGRKKYRNNERQVIIEEKIRANKERIECSRFIELMQKHLTQYLTRTLRGRYYMNRLARGIRKECKDLSVVSLDDMKHLYQSVLQLIALPEAQQDQAKRAFNSIQVKRCVDSSRRNGFDVIQALGNGGNGGNGGGGSGNGSRKSHVGQVGNGVSRLVCWQHQWSFDLARSSVMEAGHKHALEWSRTAFRTEQGGPPWCCLRCKGGFALYGHKVKHEHLHADTGGGCCWTSTTGRTCTAGNTTSTHTVEVEKDNNQARTVVETFVKSILTRFLSKSTEGRIHATSTGSAS